MKAVGNAIPWLAAVGVLAFLYVNAHRYFHKPDRPDGNDAHIHIDFGGQWLMGRTLATGRGHDLYSRDAQREVLSHAYPESNQDPAAKISDVEHMMRVTIDLGDGRGGALYPPLEAFLFLPYALGDHPQAAYFAHQWVLMGCLVASGACIAPLTGWRFPCALLLVLLFPGTRSNLELGQNGPITLLILVAGWLARTNGRPALAGAVWGLLAYKPVWAASFFFALLLLREWRMAAAMVGTGVLLGLATLPFVGLHSWFDWLAIGSEAAKEYRIEENWVNYSRDLLGLPRRWLIDFDLPRAERIQALPTLAGQACWTLVLLGTLWGWKRGRRSPGFLFLAAYLLTYHFMWYDVVAALLPLALLLRTEARRVVWIAIGTLALLEAHGYRWDLPWREDLIPWETVVLLGLWTWLLFHPPQAAQGGADVRLPHQ